MLAEAHHMVAGLEFGNTNELIDQGLTDEE